MSPLHPTILHKMARWKESREMNEALTHMNSGDLNEDLAHFLLRQNIATYFDRQGSCGTPNKLTPKNGIRPIASDLQFITKKKDKFFQEGKETETFCVGTEGWLQDLKGYL